jgi:hypothetical protein
MRIRCIALEPTTDQQVQLGASYQRGRTDYDLDLLREYVVLGISFRSGIAWAEIATDGGWLLPVPLFLFEITDARSSRYWEVRIDEQGMSLWPSRFYELTFNSKLADDEPTTVEAFREIRQLIEQEALSTLPS